MKMVKQLLALDSGLIEMAMSFFEGEIYRVPSREDLGYMDNFNQFMGAARKLAENILAVQLAVVEPVIDSDRVEFIIDAHGQTMTNELGLLTGHSGGPLSEQGTARARAFRDADRLPQVILSSDSARTLHHTIEKYFPDYAANEAMRMLTHNSPESLDHSYGLIDRDVQLTWLKTALELGIIPTPLLRAQYYGLMELFPDKEDDKALAKAEEKLRKKHWPEAEIRAQLDQLQHTLAERRQYCYQKQTERFQALGYEDARIQQDLDSIREALSRRSDPKYSMVAKDGRQLTEQRVDLDKRVDFLLNLLAPSGPLFELAMGKRIQIVSH
jgi:bisphosphoglycerate-dependent phosphoglycerate mutase